ncbi:MAG: hypothetical protein P1V97_14045 [Planctomycetota bacterium]|nr:hypothetical protein [Planctomycetota bacterium]
MKSKILSTLLILLSLQGLAFGQEPESKPASKPAPDKAKKAEETPKKEVPIHRQIGKDLASNKELKEFLKSFNKSATALLAGAKTEDAFPNIEVKSRNTTRPIESWDELKKAGAAKLVLLGLEIIVEVPEGDDAGARLKMTMVFHKNRVFLVPNAVYESEEKFTRRGVAEKDLDKTFTFVGSLAKALIKKAGDAKRSKNFPFIREDDFEALADIAQKGMTKEEWKEGLKRGRAKQSKIFVKLKAGDPTKITMNIDDAMLRVEDKDGKLIGLLRADFHISKKGGSVQFRSFKSRD